jgi:3,4-dihydroxy 2-butanone 4-phosphate synthase/GTP cyclohydrolase II
VILRQPEEPGAIMESLKAGGASRAESSAAATELRTYGVGAQILLDLGVTRMRVLSQPKHLRGISGFGLEVVEYVTPD